MIRLTVFQILACEEEATTTTMLRGRSAIARMRENTANDSVGYGCTRKTLTLVAKY